MTNHEDPHTALYDSVKFWEHSGYESDSDALDVLQRVINHINGRCDQANVAECHVEINHPDFDARSDGAHIVTVWVTSHDNDTTTLPPKSRGFRQPRDDIKVDVRRF